MKIKFNAKVGNLMTQEQLLMKKIELAQIKKQIDMIASFLPDEILRLNERDFTQTHRYVGVLMMTQICGFTTLTEKYNKIGKGGIYKLTATMNAYIGSLIETFYYYGADVLKFSGEILLTLWKVKPDSSIYEILHEVIVCAFALQQMLGNFETEINVTLQLKLAITCGNMSFTVIGDYKARNYFVIGDAIIEAKNALIASSSGDVVVGAGAWAHILHERYETTMVGNDFVKVWKIYYKPNEISKKKQYEEKQIEVLKLIEKHIALRDMLHSRNKVESTLTMGKIIENFVQSLPTRVEMKNASKYWKVNELRPFIIKPIQDQVDESQPVEYLTDMREVTVQCIKILPNMINESTIVVTLQEAYKIIYRISSTVLGVISKVVLLDKDIMILIIFGLKSVRHEFESQNALRSGFEIKKSLMLIKDVVHISVSITSGFIYCGVIGHPLRREYVIIGAAFNRAIKMTSTYINVVSCDKKTFKMSRLSSFYFLLLPSNRTRDADDLGQVFEYNECFEDIQRPLKDIEKLFGRDEEFNLVRAIIYGDDYVKGVKGICFDGPEGIGKSSIMNHCYYFYSESSAFNTALVNLTSAAKVPYFCISKLYTQLYNNRTSLNNDDIEVILNLPSTLKDQQDYSRLAQDDIAVRKYGILRCVRDMFLCSNKTTILFIDNFEHVDLQSWEIIDIISSESNFRMVATSNFREHHLDMKFKLSLNDNFKILECAPLDDIHIPSLVCMFLNIHGIPKYLIKLLSATCEGRPGFIKNSLLRLVNEYSITFNMIDVSEKDEERYIYLDLDNKAREDKLLVIAVFSDTYEKTKHEVLTIAAISVDLYDSLPPYHQLVIKTASVLGEIFIRTLLIVALKYPAEFALAKVVKTLFEEDIFDCGTKYVNASSVTTTETCCVCYFEEDYFTKNERGELPKYAYCKNIHFKNHSIRQVAYDLLPDNQKKELHLMCTEVIEYMTHFCPKCIREPSNFYLNFGHFKDAACNVNNYVADEINLEEIKDCIRDGIYGNVDFSDEESGAYSSNTCNCLEIFSRNYKSLIYHSESAGHLGKRIFFTMVYGMTLIGLDDHIGAIEVLITAKEVCMSDVKSGSEQITETFRRLHMGKINYGLAKVFTDLHQLRTAKNYLSVALRQYNIPSVAVTYKSFNMLLTRSFLVNTRRLKPIVPAISTLGQNDLSACLSLCGKLFFLEGKWNLSKLCCAYSIFIMKMLNPSIPVLYEVYCNAMDVYKHCDQIHTCERLIRFVKRDLQANYANNNTQNMFRLTDLLNNIFQIKYISGDICGSIRLGYRILDISLQLYTQNPQLDVQVWLTNLLVYNFRLHDALIISSLIRHNIRSSKLSYYYIYSLIHIIRTGLHFEDPETIIQYAIAHHINKTKGTVTWMDYLYYSVIFTYYMAKGSYQLAKQWRFDCDFSMENTSRQIVMTTLMFSTEARLYLFLRLLRHNLSIDAELQRLTNNLEIINSRTKEQYKLYRPLYYIYKAWFCKLRKRNRLANKVLKKARKLSEEQNNWMYYCWTEQIAHGWKHRAPNLNEISKINNADVIDMTQLQWTRLMKTLPLE